jgi:hypothetical protein
LSSASSNPRASFKTSFRLCLTANPASCRPFLLWSTHSCPSLFVICLSFSPLVRDCSTLSESRVRDLMSQELKVLDRLSISQRHD